MYIRIYSHVNGAPPFLHDFLLLSNLQCFCSGAFKFRGASNAIFSLSEGEARNGVLTHSRLEILLILSFSLHTSLQWFSMWSTFYSLHKLYICALNLRVIDFRLYFKYSIDINASVVGTMLLQWLWPQRWEIFLHILWCLIMRLNARSKMWNGTEERSSFVNQLSNQENVRHVMCKNKLVLLWSILSTMVIL